MISKKFRYWIATAAALAWVFASGWTAQATPLFDVPFTGDTPGNPPTTTAANTGGVSTDATLLVEQDNNGSTTFEATARVANTYTDTVSGNVFGDGNVAVLNNEGGDLFVYRFQGDAADEATSGIHTVSFDLMLDSRADGSGNFFITVKNQAAGIATSDIFIELDTGNVRDGLNAGSVSQITKGVIKHFDWVFDLDISESSLYINGEFTNQLLVDPSGALGLVDIFMGTSSVVGTVAIDNFQILAGEQIAVIPGDFDADLDVDGVDFLVWQQGFDDTFNSADLAKWEGNFGDNVGLLVGVTAAAVPEPASIFLFVIGLTWLTTFGRKNCERGFAT